MNKQLEVVTKHTLGDLVVPIHEAIDPDRKNSDSYPTGIEFLDDAMEEDEKRGFKDGDLMIISGKSGHGKTMVALNLIQRLLENGVPSILFSYEVIIDNIYRKFRQMGMEEQPLIYTPKKNITGDINWVKEKIMEADQKFGAKVAVIDHLDFLTAKDITTDDRRRNEISNIVNDIKQFAIDEKKVIILLAHILKTRERKLANEDIADSRSVVNIPDYIMFVGRELDNNGVAVGNYGIMKLTKNRFTGRHVAIKFDVYNSKIMSYELLGENS